MNPSDKIYVAGHRGLAGSAIIRRLKKEGFYNIVVRSSKQLDLREQSLVREFFSKEKPKYVFLAAAKVGGIIANQSFPGEFIYDNLLIEANIIHQSYLSGVEKLLFLGSSCIYPKYSMQPIKEEYLLTGVLESSNDSYAIAKIAGVKLCQSYNKQYGNRFISVMPTNLYGPGDNYDLRNCHVLPALIRKFYEAKINNQDSVTIWGTGNPRREFMHADDAAAACFFLMQKYNDSEIINIGLGKDYTILEIANIIKNIVEFNGYLSFDYDKPDGTPRKLLNVDKLNNLGWSYSIELSDGIRNTYNNFEKNYYNYTNS